MLNEIFIITIAVIAGIVLFVLGWLFGVDQREILDRLKSMQEDINRWYDQQEEAEEDESAIIETTPQSIRDKASNNEAPDEESAIVTVKSPREVRQAKDAKLQRELDKLSS